jgi:hypothetical protein
MIVTTQPYSNFQWLPWIGDNYLNSNKKLLIVGESHYDSEEREGDLEDRECIRWFVGGVGVNSPNNPQRFIRNVERALFALNPTDEQKGQFWHSVAYHVLVQRILESIDERPTNEDYVNSW